jgi:hypothetical protein
MTKDIRDILAAHAKRYPFWGVEDLYKLIHQSAMGSEHAVKDERKVADWLVRELEEMGPGPEEPLLDPISPDGSILRVHLRPFAQRGFDHGLLLNAFIQTAREFQGSQKRIENYKENVVELVREDKVQIDPKEIFRFFEEMKAIDYPAVHHSPVFSEHYRPAYRVVANRYLPQDISGVA